MRHALSAAAATEGGPLAEAAAALAVPGRLRRAGLGGDADVAGELLEPLPAARSPRA
jgi:hypothetical protein